MAQSQDHEKDNMEGLWKSPRRTDMAWLSKFRITIAVLGLMLLVCVFRATYSGHRNQLDLIPYSPNDIVDFFAHYEGCQDCAITSQDVYLQPSRAVAHNPKALSFCKDRSSLLKAISGGGRHGFDAPFFPKDCHYRWYTTAEICMILERFDGVVFIGDSMLQHVYAAFNILLRENLALGGLRQWDMAEAERRKCRCDNQFTRQECSKYFVSSNDQVRKNDANGGHSSPYLCDRTPHMYLPVSTSPAPDAQHKALSDLLAAQPDSYKPVAVVHSLSFAASFSAAAAAASMAEWLGVADRHAEASLRSVPFLWLGATAVGHLKPPAQPPSQGNGALWRFAAETEAEARRRGMDALGMYNLTLQASSWDGVSYGEKVALVQAMSVINWLSRLEST